MRRVRFSLFLGMVCVTQTLWSQQTAQENLRVFLNEVQPGTLTSPQYCTLVFSDRRFHTEKADIKHGHDTDRKIYEGQLSDADWNALSAIIDSNGFRDLNVPATVPPPVMQDTHPYTISVAREGKYQNMEFLDSKSLKPYESQIKPLLQWWKSVRGQHTPESKAPKDSRCALDSTHGIFSQ